MTALPARDLPVTGRMIPRYRGEPVPHELTFRAPPPPGIPGYRDGGEIAQCTCGTVFTLDGGHSAEDKDRLARQHATGQP